MKIDKSGVIPRDRLYGKYNVRIIPEDRYAESFSSGYYVLEKDGVEVARKDLDWWGNGIRELNKMASDLEKEGHPCNCRCMMCRD